MTIFETHAVVMLVSIRYSKRNDYHDYHEFIGPSEENIYIYLDMMACPMPISRSPTSQRNTAQPQMKITTSNPSSICVIDRYILNYAEIVLEDGRPMPVPPHIRS